MTNFNIIEKRKNDLSGGYSYIRLATKTSEILALELLHKLKDEHSPVMYSGNYDFIYEDDNSQVAIYIDKEEV